jgi:hypothetical protein
MTVLMRTDGMVSVLYCKIELAPTLVRCDVTFNRVLFTLSL